MMMWNNLYFQNPASSSMQMVTLMYDFLSLMLISILMILVMLSMNFFFSKEFSHFLEDDNLEMVWTLLPMLVLIYILIPSLECLYMMDSCIFCGVDVVVTGHQWYWTYNYKDLGSNILYDSYMTPLGDTLIRLLDVDNRLILPTHTPTRLMVTSADVLHSWTVPSFGLKMDAVPGRLNQICFTPMRSGVFFGQCSEICGANHSFMPIVVETVPFKDFLNSIFLL